MAINTTDKLILCTLCCQGLLATTSGSRLLSNGILSHTRDPPNYCPRRQEAAKSASYRARVDNPRLGRRLHEILDRHQLANHHVIEPDNRLPIHGLVIEAGEECKVCHHRRGYSNRAHPLKCKTSDGSSPWSPILMQSRLDIKHKLGRYFQIQLPSALLLPTSGSVNINTDVHIDAAGPNPSVIDTNQDVAWRAKTQFPAILDAELHYSGNLSNAIKLVELIPKRNPHHKSVEPHEWACIREAMDGFIKEYYPYLKKADHLVLQQLLLGFIV